MFDFFQYFFPNLYTSWISSFLRQYKKILFAASFQEIVLYFFLHKK